MKKLISAVLTVAMMFSLIIVPVHANEGTPKAAHTQHDFKCGYCVDCGFLDPENVTMKDGTYGHLDGTDNRWSALKGDYFGESNDFVFSADVNLEALPDGSAQHFSFWFGSNKSPSIELEPYIEVGYVVDSQKFTVRDHAGSKPTGKVLAESAEYVWSADSAWHNLVLSRKGNTVKLYFDGIEMLSYSDDRVLGSENYSKVIIADRYTTVNVSNVVVGDGTYNFIDKTGTVLNSGLDAFETMNGVNWVSVDGKVPVNNGIHHDNNWVAATCSSPKTCSNCGATEGEKDPDAHKYLSDGKCEYCHQDNPDADCQHPDGWLPATCKDPEMCPVCKETRGEKLKNNSTFDGSGYMQFQYEEQSDKAFSIEFDMKLHSYADLGDTAKQYDFYLWSPVDGGSKIGFLMGSDPLNPGVPGEGAFYVYDKNTKDFSLTGVFDSNDPRDGWNKYKFEMTTNKHLKLYFNDNLVLDYINSEDIFQSAYMLPFVPENMQVSFDNVVYKNSSGEVGYSCDFEIPAGTDKYDYLNKYIYSGVGKPDEPGNYELVINDVHTWVDATCSVPKTCSVCGETSGDVNPDNHTFVHGNCIGCNERQESENLYYWHTGGYSNVKDKAYPDEASLIFDMSIINVVDAKETETNIDFWLNGADQSWGYDYTQKKFYVKTLDGVKHYSDVYDWGTLGFDNMKRVAWQFKDHTVTISVDREEVLSFKDKTLTYAPTNSAFIFFVNNLSIAMDNCVVSKSGTYDIKTEPEDDSFVKYIDFENGSSSNFEDSSAWVHTYGHSGGTATCQERAICAICKEKGDIDVPYGEADQHDYSGENPCICTICKEDRHEWQPATCDLPETCSRCKETKGEALGHTYTEVGTVVAPTCFTEGYTYKMCTTCGNIDKTDIVAKLEHNFKHNVCTLCGTRNATEGTTTEWKWASEGFKAAYQYFYSPVGADSLVSVKGYENFTWIMDLNVRAKVGDDAFVGYVIGKDGKGTAGYYFKDKKFKVTYDGNVLAESAEYDWAVNSTNWVELSVKVNDGNVYLYADGVEMCKTAESNDNFKGENKVQISKNLVETYIGSFATANEKYDFNERYNSNSDGDDEDEDEPNPIIAEPTFYPFKTAFEPEEPDMRPEFLALFESNISKTASTFVDSPDGRENYYKGGNYFDTDSSIKYSPWFVFSANLLVKGTNKQSDETYGSKFFFQIGTSSQKDGELGRFKVGYDFDKGYFFAGTDLEAPQASQKFDLTQDEWHEFTLRLVPDTDEDGATATVEMYIDGALAFSYTDPDLELSGEFKEMRFLRVFNAQMSIKNEVYGSIANEELETVEYNGYTVHRGGTADCVKGAVCEDCGVEYTAVDPENHKDPQNASCLEDGICTACKEVVKPAINHHDFDEKGVCKVCGSIAGDVNGNGELEDKDIILILRLAGDLWKGVVVKDISVAELTGDNKVNDEDAVMLLRFSSNWKGIEFKSSEVKQIGDKPDAPTEPTTEEATTKPDPVPAA